MISPRPLPVPAAPGETRLRTAGPRRRTGRSLPLYGQRARAPWQRSQVSGNKKSATSCLCVRRTDEEGGLLICHLFDAFVEGCRVRDEPN